MGRGANAPVGSERVSQNGYHYTKTALGWESTHRMLMENKLGRKLEKHERVTFKNNNKRDLRPENLVLTTIKTNTDTLKKRKAELECKIEELQGQLMAVEDEIHKNTVSQVV